MHSELKPPEDAGMRAIFQHLIDYSRILEREGKIACAWHVNELALSLCKPAKPSLVH